MATAGGFKQGLNKVNPPLKGSFPLDRHGLCKQFMMQWHDCISKNLGNSSLCRIEAATYLKCRADNNLMAPEEPEYLGFTLEEWDEVMKRGETH